MESFYYLIWAIEEESVSTRHLRSRAPALPKIAKQPLLPGSNNGHTTRKAQHLFVVVTRLWDFLDAVIRIVDLEYLLSLWGSWGQPRLRIMRYIAMAVIYGIRCNLRCLWITEGKTAVT